MIGITSYGAYIPIYRLSRETLGQMWGRSGGRGEKAIANHDEDAITMAVEAVLDCLNGRDRKAVDGLYFATMSSPYIEKQCASIVATASDLRSDLFTADFRGSLRGAASAMRAAIDAIKGGSAKTVVVVASERRVPAPNSELEPLLGDGAAAFSFGDSEVAVSVEGSYAVSSEFLDWWRTENDTFHRTWEDRFIYLEGYLKILKGAVSELMKRHGLTPKDFAKAVFYAPDSRRHQEMARSLGFDTKTQVQDPLLDTLGNTGTASVPMMLVAALEEAKPGDRILLASYGDGSEVYILQVTEQIEKVRNRRGIKRHLASKMMIPNYGKYVKYRDLMEWEPERRPERSSSLPIIWRERRGIFVLAGNKCRHCGKIQYPKERICNYCQAKDDFDEVKLSDKIGKVFTYSMDERAMVGELPSVLCIVDLEGGGRLMLVMTDRDVEKVEVNMDVEMTFRKFHDGGGFYNYFWKCRPIRCEGGK